MNKPLPETHETGSEEETRALGRQLGEQAGPGTVFLLSGDLGAGKTCLVKGIATGLGLDPDRLNPGRVGRFFVSVKRNDFRAN